MGLNEVNASLPPGVPKKRRGRPRTFKDKFIMEHLGKDGVYVSAGKKNQAGNDLGAFVCFMPFSSNEVEAGREMAVYIAEAFQFPDGEVRRKPVFYHKPGMAKPAVHMPDVKIEERLFFDVVRAVEKLMGHPVATEFRAGLEDEATKKKRVEEDAKRANLMRAGGLI